MSTSTTKKKAAPKKKASVKKAAASKAAKSTRASAKPAAKKKSVKKAAAKSRTMKVKQQSISYQMRYQMIQEAAYHIAEKQNFAPDNELAHWLEAETQIDDWIKAEKIQLTA